MYRKYFVKKIQQKDINFRCISLQIKTLMNRTTPICTEMQTDFFNYKIAVKAAVNPKTIPGVFATIIGQSFLDFRKP